MAEAASTSAGGQPAQAGDSGPEGGTDSHDRSDKRGLKSLVTDIGGINAKDVNSFPLAGTDMVVRVGQYGPYLERGDQKANIPDDMAPDELTPEKAEELLNQPSGDKILGTDPATGHVLVAKSGRYGPYVTEQLETEGSKDKPRTASLLKTMTLDTVTLDDALKLLSLPRVLGEVDGEPVTVQNGRYGDVKRGTDSRSLAGEEDMFTVTLAEAKGLARPAQGPGPGRRGGDTAAARPRRGSGDREADGDQGRPVRPLRHRR